jgi:parvulin-like peptidyl-prolyl isomerase
MSQRAAEVQQRALVAMISSRLLLQEAERLYDLEQIKKELLKQFKERNKVRADEELDKKLSEAGLTRDELIDKLLIAQAPGYVVDLQVERSLSVSDQEARDYYKAHEEKFTTPGEVTFRELVMTAPTPEEREKRRPEAGAVLAQARSGKEFEQLVRDFSDSPSRSLGGLIGPVSPKDLVPAVSIAAETIPVGSVSDLIATDQGWHIIKVENRKDARVAPFDDVRNEVEAAVREAKFGPAYESYVSGLWKAATVEVRRDYAARMGPPWSGLVKLR